MFVTNVFGRPTSSYEVVFSTENIKYLRRLLRLIMSFCNDLINNIAFSRKFLLIAVGSFLLLVIGCSGQLFVLSQRILLLQISLYFCNEIALYLFFHFSSICGWPTTCKRSCTIVEILNMKIIL